MGINRRDWKYDRYPQMVMIQEINRVEWTRELVGWISLEEAKKVCEGFLSFYYDWLLEHEPRAYASHHEITDILGLIQGDLNEVLRTE